MKKFFTLIVLCIMSFNAVHAEITWTLSDDGTLTISGTGEMDENPWDIYQRAKIKKVIIKNGITNIGECAFMYCDNLVSVTIPNSVTNIGSYAFQYCYNLASIYIPSSVANIGYSAFGSCTGLTSIVIGDVGQRFVGVVGGIYLQEHRHVINKMTVFCAR